MKAGAFHRRTRDAVIHEKQDIRVSFFLGGLLEYLFLIADAVGLAVHIRQSHLPFSEQVAFLYCGAN